MGRARWRCSLSPEPPAGGKDGREERAGFSEGTYPIVRIGREGARGFVISNCPPCTGHIPQLLKYLVPEAGSDKQKPSQLLWGQTKDTCPQPVWFLPPGKLRPKELLYQKAQSFRAVIV